MGQVEVKGQSIRTTMQIIGELWGEKVARSVFDGVGGPFADALRAHSIVFGGWYPIAWYGQIHDLLSQLLPSGVDFARSIGRATTEKDLSGIYQFILALTTPGLIARHFDKIVASYLRGGTIAVSVTEKAFAVYGRGWEGMTPSLWQEAASGIEVIFERAGAKCITPNFREVPGETFQVDFSWQ